jgi:hypothetical protein
MTPLGIDPATFRFVAQCFNHCATACPHNQTWSKKIPNLRTRSWVNTMLTQCRRYAERGESPVILVTTAATKSWRSCKKHESVTLHYSLSTGRHLFGISFITSLKVKFTHNSNHKQHKWKELYHLARTKHDCNLAQCIFSYNTPVNGPKQRTVGLPKPESLPRSTSNFSA